MSDFASTLQIHLQFHKERSNEKTCPGGWGVDLVQHKPVFTIIEDGWGFEISEGEGLFYL